MKSKIITKLLMFAILLFALMSSVNALGIAPAVTSEDFKPDLQQEFSFTVYSENNDVDLIVYPRGEFSEFVLIDQNLIHMEPGQTSVKVRYKVFIPHSLRKPGHNVVEIVVEETPSEYDKQTAIGGKVAVVHKLELKLPFLGSHATAKFTTNNPRPVDLVKFTFGLTNDGAEDIDDMRAVVEVLNNKGESMGTDEYEIGLLKAGEVRKEIRSFSKVLIAGNYDARARIYYDGKVINEFTSFVVGGPYVEIESIGASDFRLGSINKIDLAVYNGWSEQINNVYGEVIVKDSNNKIYTVFKTISIDLLPFSGNTLFGYWDTSSMEIGDYILQVKLHYNGLLTEKEFDIKLLQDELRVIGLTGEVVRGPTKERDSTVSILIVAFIILMIFNVLLIIYMKRTKKPPIMDNMKYQMIILLFAVLIKIHNFIF